MKAGFITLVSKLHHDVELTKRIELYSDKLIAASINPITNHDFENYDLLFILIASGGTEELFLQEVKSIFDSKASFFLISTTTDNSLPASMEILSWTKQNHIEECKGVIHGMPEKVMHEIEEEIKISSAIKAISNSKVGIIGKPSDWLIASEVAYLAITSDMGISFEHISMNNFIKVYENLTNDSKDFELSSSLANAFSKYSEDSQVYKDSQKLYITMKEIIKSHKLNGLTIRCFDLLDKIKNTGCLALSQLNDEGIPAACEGDVPALFTMMAVENLGLGPSFMANPSHLEENCITFAHCTSPCKLLEHFHVTSHFESGIGLAVGGTFPANTKVTVLKIGDSHLSQAIILEGTTEPTDLSPNLCRTQIKIKLSNTEYFLQNPLGNHHLIIMGHHKRILQKFCKNLKISCL